MNDPRRSEIWWTDLGPPSGSGPGFRRPVVVIQSDSYNRRPRLATVVVAILTGNLSLAKLPGNVLLTSEESGLPHDSVVNVTQLVTINKSDLLTRVGLLPPYLLLKVDEGLQLVLDLDFSR